MRVPLRPVLAGAAVVLLLAAAAGGLWFTQGDPAPEPVPEAAEESLPLPPEPPRVADSPEYEECLGKLRDDAQGALSFAEAWEGQGGGDGARHCSALATLALGDPQRAATRLEALAARTPGTAARAAIFGQAGQAWTVAGQPSRAYGAFTLALAITPNDVELLVDRAIAAAALGRFADALADADRAIAQDSSVAEPWVFRAAALRRLERPQEALRDIERALSLDPGNPEALLERGILRQLAGDEAGARADWESVIAASPDSAAADLAQQNLALNAAGPVRR
ncbi:tetratricopeptide repeat protein [Muricoccus radiodurans]|uniref:tetratricopeptide repeat protein n=1 Tax=Muricoccus radiodurans TaxID=2231721 RepID=UPI003CED7EC8